MKFFDDKKIEQLSNDEAKKLICLEKEVYNKYFNKIKNKFTETYLNTYKKNDHFHDFNLSNINLYYKKWNDLRISLFINFKDEYKYKIIHTKVKHYESNFSSLEYPLIWLYDEYEYDYKDNFWIHRIMFTDDNIISITSKNIILKDKNR